MHMKLGQSNFQFLKIDLGQSSFSRPRTLSMYKYRVEKNANAVSKIRQYDIQGLKVEKDL